MRITIAIATAVAAFSLTGCGNTVEGKISAIYDNTSSYLYDCVAGQWAIVVVKSDNTEHGNCVDANTAKSYIVGEHYPRK